MYRRLHPQPFPSQSWAKRMLGGFRRLRRHRHARAGIVDGAHSVTLFGEDIPIRARIHTINGFSAHADQRGLINWHPASVATRQRSSSTARSPRWRTSLRSSRCLVSKGPPCARRTISKLGHAASAGLAKQTTISAICHARARYPTDRQLGVRNRASIRRSSDSAAMLYRQLAARRIRSDCVFAIPIGTALLRFRG